MASVALTCIVIAVVVGLICATEGELNQDRPRLWFVAGVASVIVGTLLGGWLQAAFAAGPVLAALAIEAPPHHHELTYRARHRRNVVVGELAIAMVVVLVPYAALSGFLASAQRTEAARPTIVATEQILVSSSHPYSTIGRLTTRITYTFEAEGGAHKGVAQHQWTADQIASTKVCYDPNDVDGSHALELADYHCGSFDLHPTG